MTSIRMLGGNLIAGGEMGVHCNFEGKELS